MLRIRQLCGSGTARRGRPAWPRDAIAPLPEADGLGFCRGPEPPAMIYNEACRVIKQIHPHSAIGDIPRESAPKSENAFAALVVLQEWGQLCKNCQMLWLWSQVDDAEGAMRIIVLRMEMPKQPLGQPDDERSGSFYRNSKGRHLDLSGGRLELGCTYIFPEVLHEPSVPGFKAGCDLIPPDPPSSG